MDFLAWSAWLKFAITVVFGTLLSFVAIIFLMPSQYKPYGGDFVEAEDSSKGDNAIKASTSVQIIVVGDIGRSPRMQYHAISLAKHRARVDLIGFTDSEVHPELRSNAFVTIVPLSAPPGFLRTDNKWFFLIVGPLKVIWQTCTLISASGYRARPSKWMLIQNPPSIPTILVAVCLCYLRNTRLVVDWHNLGYSVLAQKLGAFHILVWFASWYETYAASAAYAHFAVTDAMTNILKEMTSLKVSKLRSRPPFIVAQTLHDRPSSDFKPLTKSERSEVLKRLPETAQYAKDIEKGSWALLVSSTSWTTEEDFSLFLAALVGYSSRAEQKSKMPKILAIITGKGPQKEYYKGKIQELNQAKKLSQVIVLTAWFSNDDYASLLGAADLGVSLHKSTSGVDFPMKVIDMFGAGLPVVGWSDFEAWTELIKEDVNGKGFHTSAELRDLLIELLHGDRKLLAKLREGAIAEGGKRWDDEWDAIAGKLFRVVSTEK